METAHSAQGSSIASWLRLASESLFAAIFPGSCRFCTAALTRISRLPVCDDCLHAVRPLQGLTCAICGEHLAGPGLQPDELRCPECIQNQPIYRRAVAYGSYEGTLRGLVRLLKYERVRPAAEVLGRMLSRAVSALLDCGELSSPVVVPVPLHPARQRQRGFNQSELIARAMLSHLPESGLRCRSRALKRRRATDSQTGLTRAQRGLNLRGAFVVANTPEVAGRDIVLVDDVFTTGTTVSECARVLSRAGATGVWVATVARVLDPSTRNPGLLGSLGNTATHGAEGEPDGEGALSLP